MVNEIWHGDSRELAADLPDGVNCVIIDPPYGVDYQSRRAQTPQGKKIVNDIEGDGDLEGAFDLFDGIMDAVLPKSADVCELYVFTRWDIVGDWIECVRRLTRHGFSYKMLLVWSKGYPGMGDIDCNWGCGHEIILYLKKGRRDVPERRSGVVTVNQVPAVHMIHPTEKPVDLMKRLISMSTDPGNLVVDPCSGSGATVVAAQRLGRNAIGIEKDIRYISDSRKRLEQMTLV